MAWSIGLRDFMQMLKKILGIVFAHVGVDSTGSCI